MHRGPHSSVFPCLAGRLFAAFDVPSWRAGGQTARGPDTKSGSATQSAVGCTFQPRGNRPVVGWRSGGLTLREGVKGSGSAERARVMDVIRLVDWQLAPRSFRDGCGWAASSRARPVLPGSAERASRGTSSSSSSSMEGDGVRADGAWRAPTRASFSDST